MPAESIREAIQHTASPLTKITFHAWSKTAQSGFGTRFTFHGATTKSIPKVM
jgi:hypothetical protein